VYIVDDSLFFSQWLILMKVRSGRKESKEPKELEASTVAGSGGSEYMPVD
jgi:hypothetical protein